MRMLFFTLSSALLFSWASSAQTNVTPEDLRNNGGGPWACVDVVIQDGNYKLTNTPDDRSVRLEKVDGKLILLSASDSLFIHGASEFRIDLPPQSGIVLHNRELKQYRKPRKNQTNMSIPRPFVLNREQDKTSWVFNLVKQDGNVLEQITVLRDWPSAPPTVTLFFNHEDNLNTLGKDSVLTVACDSSIFCSSREGLVLSKIRINKAPDGRFIRLDKILINDHPYHLTFYKKPSERADAAEDAFSSDYFAETSFGQNLNSIKSITVDYSYLDNDLGTISAHSIHSVQQYPNKSHRAIRFNTLSTLSCILLGLLLLFAFSLMFVAPARSRITIPGKKGIGNAPALPADSVKVKNTETANPEEKKSSAKVEKDDLAQRITGLLTTIEKVFGRKKDNETYSQFIERRGHDLVSNESASAAVFGRPQAGETYETFYATKKERIYQLDKMIRQYFGQIPDKMKYSEFFQKIKSESDADKNALNQLQDAVKRALGTPAAGQDYAAHIVQKTRELSMLPNILQALFGPLKPGESYESLLKSTVERLSYLEDLDKAVTDIYGQPAVGEATISLLRRSSQSLKESLELEKRNTQLKLDAQKQKLEHEHTAAVNDILEKLQKATESREVDLRQYCSSQLAILARMRNAYNGSSKYISSGSKFGEYAKHIGISLLSFIEQAESAYKKIGVEDSTASMVEKVSPAIQKALNDHTSWLNALTRLEAYARTAALRKQMLKDGIQLSSLTELFYSAQEFLYNNRYILNPLPDLFADTDNLDDYNCDNMDIVISNLFDYEEEVLDNAIVDIIKIGYSYKNEPIIKTTVAYYSKPKA